MRPKGVPAEVTRRRLLDSSIELFALQGFAATGIREIAAAAGLSSSSLYEHVATKDDLLVAIMRESIDPLIAAGARIVGEQPSPEACLVALVERHVAFHVAHPLATLVTDTELRALRGARREEVVGLRDRYESIWRTIVAAGVREQIFSVPDQRVCVRALLGLCTGITAWYRPGGRVGVERLGGIHADMALATVRATRDGVPLRRADVAVRNDRSDTGRLQH